jgi:hypothetical protein
LLGDKQHQALQMPMPILVSEEPDSNQEWDEPGSFRAHGGSAGTSSKGKQVAQFGHGRRKGAEETKGRGLEAPGRRNDGADMWSNVAVGSLVDRSGKGGKRPHADYMRKGGMVEHLPGKGPGTTYAPMPRVGLETDLRDAFDGYIGKETPPYPSMQSHQVLRPRGHISVHPAQGQVVGSKSSSFETALIPAGLQDDVYDDDDDEDYYDDFGEKSSPSLRYMNAAPVDEAILEDIYHLYLAQDPNITIEPGVTIMLRDIPYRLKVEPDLYRILTDTADLKHVSYIYLPMTIEGFNSRTNVQSRNKGYCFIHFSVEATAHTFASRVCECMTPDVSGGKNMFAARAKFQGVGMTLINLLDISSKKWRPKHGVAYMRSSTGELVCVGLLPLRNLVKRRTVRPNWQSDWPGAKTGTQQRAPFSGNAKHRQ